VRKGEVKGVKCALHGRRESGGLVSIQANEGRNIIAHQGSQKKTAEVRSALLYLTGKKHVRKKGGLGALVDGTGGTFALLLWGVQVPRQP